eukprot:TRINITY_DN18436_c0_g1_i1.p1 TRINITY_DN18436_c0_g1~~TRINITY_DN18436_c0_g1_i1.p1  ORF type:complete len:267 (+),score=68.50 TRINITY_DN18436_c0_g1_i1:103-903(+)
MRRTVLLLQPAKKGGVNVPGQARTTGLKPADEDRLMILMENYANGMNHLTKKMPEEKVKQLQSASRMYDRVKESQASALASLEDAHCNRQQRALRALPEVLRAAACRVTTDTWPINFRKPTMTPPVQEYNPPAVENIQTYEVSQNMVQVMHSGLVEGKTVFEEDSDKVKADGSPLDLATEENVEEERMRYLRESYLWWRGQQQYGPRAETVQRDFMKLKHEQEIKLYTIRRAKHGENDYVRKRQLMNAPLLRDDTKEMVMYKRVGK